jgi:hypothetical protein
MPKKSLGGRRILHCKCSWFQNLAIKTLAIKKRVQWKSISICLLEILIDVKTPTLNDF